MDRESIIPVQTQRVIGLRVAEKKWLLNDEYRPLVVDKDNYLIVEISTKTKKNIDKLIESVLLQAELLELKSDYDLKANCR